MIEFGRTLREAREAKGYTVSQLAEETRLMHQIVEDMENEVFSRIPAPIYGRGFVKLYCEAVGLEPKPMVDAYMAILDREKDDRKRRHKHARQPPPFIPPEPAATPAEESAAPSAGAEERQPGASRTPGFRLPRIEIPENAWRIAVVAIGALLALWALFACCRAAYRAFMTPPAPAAETAPDGGEASNPAPAANAEAAPKPRTPAEIPPLYFD